MTRADFITAWDAHCRYPLQDDVVPAYLACLGDETDEQVTAVLKHCASRDPNKAGPGLIQFQNALTCCAPRHRQALFEECGMCDGRGMVEFVYGGWDYREFKIIANNSEPEPYVQSHIKVHPCHCEKGKRIQEKTCKREGREPRADWLSMVGCYGFRLGAGEEFKRKCRTLREAATT